MALSAIKSRWNTFEGNKAHAAPSVMGIDLVDHSWDARLYLNQKGLYFTAMALKKAHLSYFFKA